jgi:predicted nucleic acid-binding protein
LRYFDTGFLVPLILQEATSRKVERFVVALPAGEVAISQLTRIEFSSLLVREVRMGGLASDAARHADGQFESMVQESFVVLMPNANDFDLAKSYLANHATGLRASDALHLAVARNHRADAIYSLDKTMLKAGRLLGLRVSTGIRLAGYGR